MFRPMAAKHVSSHVLSSRVSLTHCVQWENASMVILVYDVTNPASFQKCLPFDHLAFGPF